jgi:putative ABC transport system permease protein
VPPPTFNDWQTSQQSFSALSAVLIDALTLTGSGEPAKLYTASVSSSFFSVLGIRPALGRDFSPADDRANAPRVVILSDLLWRERFGANRNVIGRVITLDDKPFTIIGVAPRDFHFPEFSDSVRIDLLTPLVPQILADDPGGLTERGAHYLDVVGCLKPGVSLASASAEINTIEDRIAREPANEYAGLHATLVPLKEHAVSDVKLALWVLLGAVGFVLLVACANVANLLLSRAVARDREIGIRSALGASSGRLLRQLLTESLLLSSASGALGVLMAYLSLHSLLAFVPQTIPRAGEIHVNAQVLAFSLIVMALVGVLFGLVPARSAVRLSPSRALTAGGFFPSAESSRRGRPITGRILVIGEVAMTLVLLVGAGLMLKSFLRLINVNPGFRPRDVTVFQFGLDTLRYPQAAQQSAFFEQLLQRVRVLPGVRSADFANNLPFLQNMTSVVSVNGQLWRGLHTQQANVGSDFFQAMGIPLIHGRVFGGDDGPSSQPVAIVNESFVRQFLSQENPLGQHVETHFMPLRNRLIVGVVGDVHHSGLGTSPMPEVFVPFAQVPYPNADLVVRAPQATPALVPAVRAIVGSLDKDQPIDRIVTLESLLEKSVAPPRFYTYVLVAFAFLATILAVIGTHGVIAYSVSRRTHEIGVRMALGAGRGDVMGMILREGLLLAFIGIAIGVAGALALTRFLRSLLFEIKPTDPATFVGVAILLALVALAACYIPARRAMKVDPMVALRYE